MKGKRLAAGLCCMALLLSGCGFSGDHRYQTLDLHEGVYRKAEQAESVTVSDYNALLTALSRLISAHIQEATLDVSQYGDGAEEDVLSAQKEVLSSAIPAYMVRSVSTNLNEVGARRLVTVKISYRHTQEELEDMQIIWGKTALQHEVHSAMDQALSSVVVIMNGYEDMDLDLWVREYYAQHRDTVMEQPQVECVTYPNSGNTRVVELRFRYLHSSEELREMRRETQSMISSAAGYIRGQEDETVKAERLYALLHPLYTEEKTTSTPVYSLLCLGEGDSGSVALVYSLLCRQAGIECLVIDGTLEDEDHAWNLICLDGNYYHVDISTERDNWHWRLRYDEDMWGYSWNRDLYPASTRPQPEQTPPEQTEEPADRSAPEPQESEPDAPEETGET